jgi:hypothetical protein
VNNLIVRGIVAWFNDGKRISALILTALGMLLPKIRALGVPLPEGTEASLAPFIASCVLLLLSKLDVRIPVTPKP